MIKIKFVRYSVLLILAFHILLPVPVSHAASVDKALGSLASPTVETTSSGGVLTQLLDLLLNKILGPFFHAFGAENTVQPPKTAAVKIVPLPPQSLANGDRQHNGFSLAGRTIVIDPGHGGSNPGAMDNETRESDNNLAVGLKLRDKLSQAGAKVILTRDRDCTVAPEGNSLPQELQARVNMAENSHADIFVSIHSNDSADKSIAGTETFYQSIPASRLAAKVQQELVGELGSIDKGISPANFYVLRNTSMPAVLVEMGYVSNKEEAAHLQNDAYRSRVAQGIYNGIQQYFS